MTIAQLRKERRAGGITQKDLEEVTGLRRGRIAWAEAGYTKLKPEELLAMEHGIEKILAERTARFRAKVQSMEEATA